MDRVDPPDMFESDTACEGVLVTSTESQVTPCGSAGVGGTVYLGGGVVSLKVTPARLAETSTEVFETQNELYQRGQDQQDHYGQYKATDYLQG